jgi:hypothetical protein
MPFPEDARMFTPGEHITWDDEDGAPVARYRVVDVGRDPANPRLVNVLLEQVAADDRDPS